MPLPIAGGIAAWFLGLIGAVASKAFTWAMLFFAHRTAVSVARAVAFITVSGSLVVALSVAMKVAILAVQTAMPPSLAAFTYFLPSNLNQIFAVFVTLRISTFLYSWTVRNMRVVTQQVY